MMAVEALLANPESLSTGCIGNATEGFHLAGGFVHLRGELFGVSEQRGNNGWEQSSGHLCLLSSGEKFRVERGKCGSGLRFTWR